MIFGMKAVFIIRVSHLLFNAKLYLHRPRFNGIHEMRFQTTGQNILHFTQFLTDSLCKIFQQKFLKPSAKTLQGK